MFATVREFNQRFLDLWLECDETLPDLGPKYTAEAQTENEQRLSQFLEQVDQMFSNPPRNRDDAQAIQAQLGAAFRPLAEEALGFPATQLDLLPSRAFSDASEEFVRMARAFDSRLSGEDIYQAGRNAWTANSLQWLLGLPVQITPSILAYSLLYPYTDNYLDDPGVSLTTKLAFNERFRRRLAGERLSAVHPQERIIFDLIAMMENQYSRPGYPGVFESLLAIHDAQAQSLHLLHHSVSSADVDVLGLSFYKGGTSVLADGYLVSDSLNEAQRQYTYGHGIFAQLLDDMEDVRQDSQAGRLTVYSQAAGHSALDVLANRTFHFGHRILLGLQCFERSESIQDLIRRGADLFLVDAISRTDRFYTPSYLQILEAHSPFRFSFLKQQRKDFFKRHGSPGKLMETMSLFQSD